MNSIDKLDSQVARAAFFSENNAFVFKGAIERRRKAEKALKDTPSDYKTAFMLFDVRQDGEDYKWLNLMESVLSEPESPYFDWEYAQAIGHHAKKLQSHKQTQSLAWQKHLEEYFEKYDLGPVPITAIDRRKRFEMFIHRFPARFDHAYELFNPYEDCEDEDWLRLLRSTSIDLRDECEDGIFRAVERQKKRFRGAESQQSEFLADSVHFYALDKGCEYRDYRTAFAYASLMSAKIYKKHAAQEGLAFCIIAHDLLHGECDDLFDEATLAFQDKERSAAFCSCQACTETLEAVERVMPLVRKVEYRKAQCIVSNVYKVKSGGFPDHSSGFDIDAVFKQTVTTSVQQIVKDLITIQRMAAFKFEYSSVYGLADFWASFLGQWEAKIQKLDVTKVIKETVDYGPSYNMLGHNGLPVAGAYTGYFQGGPYHGHEIPAGAGILEAVKGADNGELEFKFSETPYALILPEDIDVLMVLSFCYDRHVFPAIDVPSAKTFSARHLREKYTTPPWLIYTELGRTLYTTDVWAGELAWGIEGFSTRYSHQTSLCAFRQVKEAVDSQDGLTISLFPAVNVNPKKNKISSKTYTDEYGRVEKEIQVNSLQLGIDGGFLGETRKWKYRNSKFFAHTRKTASLTENYNEIARAFPVFERLRQLMAISYALHHLRSEGFNLAPEALKTLHHKRKEFEQRLRRENKPKVCTYLPITLMPKGA